MKTLVHIFTQVHENYGKSWKPKGRFLFTLRVDSDILMYIEHEGIVAIKKLLDEQSNEHEKFTYVSHEIVWHEPKELSADLFTKYYNDECERFADEEMKKTQ
jgi:hypothetical protein